MKPIELASGQVVWGGLLVPDKKPETFPCYADHNPVLNEDQIARLVKAKGRTKARDLFPAEQYIRRQVNNGCNGFAAASCATRARVKRGLEPIVLSGDFVYANINGGRDRGSMLDDGMHFIQKSGACRDELVKVGTWRKGSISQEAFVDAKRFLADECYFAPDKEQLYSGLALGFVGVIAVHVDRDFSNIDSYGRVPPSSGPGNHSVCVDDLVIVNNELNLDSPNSWGLSWGVRGRGYYTWERHLKTTTRYHAFYLCRTTSDDPNSDKPPKIKE